MLWISSIRRPSSSTVAVTRTPQWPLSSCRCPAVPDTTSPSSSTRKRTRVSSNKKTNTIHSFTSCSSEPPSSVTRYYLITSVFSLRFQPVLEDLLPLRYHSETLDPHYLGDLRAPESPHLPVLPGRLVLPTRVPQDAENGSVLRLRTMSIITSTFI